MLSPTPPLSIHAKPILFAIWAFALCLGAMVVGVTSGLGWTAVAFAAVAPPMVVRYFWHAPEQTMSESINDARR